MKKIILRILVPILVFVFVTVLMNVSLNHGETQNTSDLASATYPVMYMKAEGYQINRMYGTAEQILDTTARETLTPINMDRTLTLMLDTKGNAVRDITYTVMSVDRSVINENAVLKQFSSESGMITVDFTLEQPTLLNQEYLLEFAVSLENGKQIYFTTRIIQRNEISLSGYLNFVANFVDSCLDKEKADFLGSYLESVSGGTANNYYDINIHSSLDQVSWGTMAPVLVSKAIPQIREMNSTTISVTQDYVIKALDEDGNTEYYLVNEFYRMRKGAEDIVLLDFERQAEQLFDPQLPILTSMGISLGTVGSNVVYKSNVAEDIAAFVVNGDLWSYNRSAGKCICVYTFRSRIGADPDIREINQNHNVHIIHVDECGDISFVVYGYMNSGEHEGQMGANVFYYRAEQNLVEEQLFIPANCSYETLCSNIENLSYISQEGFLYLYMEGTLYQINLSTGAMETVAEHISDDGFVVSDSQAQVAWETSEGIGSDSTICVLNLDTSETLVLTANEGEKLLSLGFIQEDFICGSAYAPDYYVNNDGSIRYYMHTIWIYSREGSLRKEYREDGCYVKAVSVEDGRVNMERVQKTEAGFIELEEDHITSGELQSSSGVSSRLAMLSERTGQQLVLEFEEGSQSGDTPLFLTSKYIFNALTTELKIVYPESEAKNYYVYGKGELIASVTTATEAIRLADENVGIVLNQAQQYVWERGITAATVSIDPEKEPEGFRMASLDPAVLEASLGEGQELLNLVGCTTSEIRYMLVNNRSVVVKIGPNESRLLIGYDMFGNYKMYNGETGEVTLIGSEDGPELFEENGNVFYSYTSSFS